jgi:hypothetical protein
MHISNPVIFSVLKGSLCFLQQRADLATPTSSGKTFCHSESGLARQDWLAQSAAFLRDGAGCRGRAHEGDSGTHAPRQYFDHDGHLHGNG